MTIVIFLKRISGEIGKLSKQLGASHVALKNQQRCLTVVHGKIDDLPPKVKSFVQQGASLCAPDEVHICDGSEGELKKLTDFLQKSGTIKPLPKYKNCWLALTNPADTARVESKTFICSEKQSDAIPTPKPGVKGQLGYWMSPKDMDASVQERFKNCMKGRKMYVLPFSMGPVGSPYSKIGIQLTDSAYVVASMRIMTRMGDSVLKLLKSKDLDFVKCLHSVGTPKDGKHKYPSWPCDPERTMILHKPQSNEIISYGSGYGGNSLLGKKCFALRIGSTIAKREGWFAEHMLILGITDPKGKKRYITAAFPSACGKTNLAMLTPTLPGYKVECVGDDICWMRFDNNGVLRAINPENGFFGVAPGTSNASNPIAMQTIFQNTVFTNVAATSDGGVYWEGLEKEVDKNLQFTDWHGKPWKLGDKTPSSHPNSRFCTPAKQCPIIDKAWEDPNGVPIEAILFGGRRPEGVPLIYEARSWKHGVYIGASMRSEATAAAEHKGKMVMHDPFAMRPFFGYNFGHYMQHWLDMEKGGRNMPKIFHVNWFRKSSEGKFLWPGFGDNSRVLEWVLKRLDNEDVAQDSPVGFIPKPGALNVSGLKNPIDTKQLFDIPKGFWQKEVQEIEKYFNEQVGADLPNEVANQLKELKQRINKM